MRGYGTLSSPRQRPGRKRSANTATRPSGWAASLSRWERYMDAFRLRAGFITLKAERDQGLSPSLVPHSFIQQQFLESQQEPRIILGAGDTERAPSEGDRP